MTPDAPLTGRPDPSGREPTRPPRGRPRPGTALVVVGLAIGSVGIGVLALPQERVAADVGTLLNSPDTGAAASSPSPSVRPGASGTPASGAVSVPRGEDVRRPLPSPEPAPAGFVPERLVLDVLGIDAQLVPTVVDTGGALVPPPDLSQLGWWRGVRPGSGAGSVLLAGHLDSRVYGQGPLARIVDLDVGDRAVLTGPSGAEAAYVVRGVQTIPKDQLPAAELFGSGGAERLVLVTCGGTFDRDRGHWDSNVVAVLDPETS